MAILAWLHNAYGRDLIDGIRAALPDEDIREWPEAGDPDGDRHLHRLPHAAGLPGSRSAIWQLMSATGAGIDHYLLDPDFPRGIRMVRVVDHDFASRMTDYVLAWTLFHHRDVAHFLAAQKRREWAYKIMRSARDVRVGVMGLGQMGRLAAERLAGIGYDTAAWSRSRARGARRRLLCTAPEGFGDFLARSEILDQPAAADAASRAASCRRGELRRGCRPGGVVISAARGGASRRGRPRRRRCARGSCAPPPSTPFPIEPLPADSPLWDVPNLYRHPALLLDGQPRRRSWTPSPRTSAASAPGRRTAERGGHPCRLLSSNSHHRRATMSRLAFPHGPPRLHHASRSPSRSATVYSLTEPQARNGRSSTSPAP